MKKVIMLVLLAIFAGTMLGGCKADTSVGTPISCCDRLDFYYD